MKLFSRFKLSLTSIALLLAMLSGNINAKAQNATLTPYSRYGYGMLSDNATSIQRSMGGVGYAMRSGRQINVMNPASYAAIDSLTFFFDIGMDLTSVWASETIDNKTTRENNFGGGLDYITMQVPIGKYMGASVGLLPFSSVGYSFGSTIDNGYTSREGSGSINQLYLGVAGRPFKGLTVGANIAYLFGTTYNDLYATTMTGSRSLFERQMTVRDWRADFGIQYSVKLNSNNAIDLGVVFSPGKSMHGHTFGMYYDASQNNPKIDTVGYTSLKGKYTMPETWGAGIAWRNGTRLMVEADFTYQPWSKAKYEAIENFESTTFTNRWKGALGFQYVPNARGSYFKRINYRLGAYYNHDYLVIKDNKIKEHGITAGFGFPVPSFKTTINLGFEWKHRQAHPNPLVKEDYFNITIGVNFNEMWFFKNKLN